MEVSHQYSTKTGFPEAAKLSFLHKTRGSFSATLGRMARDFYQILGVARGASADDIKKSYRKLSKELHPDKHKGDKAAEEKFKEVNQAYETLSDPQKRKMYDQFGEAGTRGGAGGFGGFNAQDFGDFSQFFRGGGGGFSSFDMGDLGEMFGFGGQQRRQPPRKGPAEVTLSVNVPLDEIAKGDFDRDVAVDLMMRCSECKGERYAKGSKMITCKTCDGKGSINKTTRIPLMGSFQMRAPCGTCHGLGKIPEKACPKCKGEGEVQVRKKLRVKIPKDIRVDELINHKEHPLKGEIDMQFRVRIPDEE
jgi:molecular chaperone DnaJ